MIPAQPGIAAGAVHGSRPAGDAVCPNAAPGSVGQAADRPIFRRFL